MKLRADPANRASREALCIYEATLREVAVDGLIARTVTTRSGDLRIGSLIIDMAQYRRVLVFGAGKASAVMAQALEAILGDRIACGVVATKHGHSVPTERVRIMEAGHPIPDGSSLAAGAAIAELAEQAGPDDLAIVLISGGASALMEMPASGLSLDDLQATTAALLRCGATINELNAVRSRLSRLKSGGLAKLLAPARTVCLVLSDVLGNPLDVIGSGPCFVAADYTIDPVDVLRRYRLDGSLPERVIQGVQRMDSRSSPCHDPSAPVDHVIIGDVRTALDAAMLEARRLGYRPLLLTASMRGEAREVGTLMGGVAHDLPFTSQLNGADCIVMGGEPTVTVRGDGVGGRCQELAAAAALPMLGARNVALLAAGTDGTDGPTDAAGSLVDGETAQRIADAGLSVDDALMRNDTYPMLDAVGGLIRSGPTGSNVGDIVIALLSS